MNLQKSNRSAPGATIVLAIISLLFAYPFLWMFLSGFKTNRQIFHPLQLWPDPFTPNYYSQLIAGDWFPFFRVFANSLLVSLLQAVGAVGLTALAGFVFAKHSFPGRRLLFALSLVVIVIPPQTLAIPLFTWINTLHLSNTLTGVILPGLVSGLGILYFTQVFRSLPNAYLDVARLAGASEFRVFLTLLPLVTSPLLSFGLIQFILAWHEHLIPLLILTSETKQTLPLALSSLYGSSLRFPFAVLMAASTLTVLPTAILFCLLYRRFKTSLSDILLP